MGRRPADDYPARNARIAAGVSLETAAARIQRRPATLARLETQGGFALGAIERLSALYQCSWNCFRSSKQVVGTRRKRR